MSRSLGLTVILYAVALAGVCGLAAARARPRPPLTPYALAMLEVGVVGQALFDLADLISGRHGPEVATNVGYLIASVLALPTVVGAVRLDQGRWGSTALAIGCVLVIVLSLRLHQTLGSPRG